MFNVSARLCGGRESSGSSLKEHETLRKAGRADQRETVSSGGQRVVVEVIGPVEEYVKRIGEYTQGIRQVDFAAFSRRDQSVR